MSRRPSSSAHTQRERGQEGATVRLQVLIAHKERGGRCHFDIAGVDDTGVDDTNVAFTPLR